MNSAPVFRRYACCAALTCPTSRLPHVYTGENSAVSMMGSGRMEVLVVDGVASSDGEDDGCRGERGLDCSSAVTRRVWMADATL